VSPITTHVLDTARGRPGEGVGIVLERRSSGGGWREAGRGTTDADGRCRSLLPDGNVLEPGVYRLVFDTASYFRSRGQESFYPSVTVEFEVRAAGEHYHVPLLLSPYGYSTYRGS
jgi:5-hydroxyisourate hydrolase